MNPIPLTLDGQPVDATPGETILQVARRHGLDIPALCYLEKCSPATSCLACVVRIAGNGPPRWAPSCATQVQPGMIVESETDEILEARRTAIELLLSDHAGDCLSPCHRICPLHLNIPLMFRQVESGFLHEAIAIVRSALPLASILGRLCNHPCENGCRRGTWDAAASIQGLERFVADLDLHAHDPYLPPRQASSGKSVVVVGSGPTGLAAAFQLCRDGHDCLVLDRNGKPGGSLRTSVAQQSIPSDVLESELERLVKFGVRFQPSTGLGSDVSLDELQRTSDAILLCLGETGPSDVQNLGLATAASGIKITPETYRLDLPNAFGAGSMVKPIKQLARAMSEGMAAARCIDQSLRHGTVRRPEKPFSSVMGRLTNDELDRFVLHASKTGRVIPSIGKAGHFTPDEAHREATRCLHCDCHAVGNCRLQHYAQICGADPSRFRTQRRPFEQQVQSGGIVFEPGKCILCGICIQVAEQAREPLGLTFIGRGFDVRVGAALNRPLAEGLQRAARDCAQACPTGAIAIRTP